MLRTAPAQPVAAYSCPPSSLLLFLSGQDTFSLCWQKSPHSPVWECKRHGFSPSTGVCCPRSHLKTFPWYLLKKLDNMQVMSCEVIYPCSFVLWCPPVSPLVLPSSADRDNTPAAWQHTALHKKIPDHCKGLQTRPQMQALRTFGSISDVPAQSPPALPYIKVSL